MYECPRAGITAELRLSNCTESREVRKGKMESSVRRRMEALSRHLLQPHEANTGLYQVNLPHFDSSCSQFCLIH